MSLAAVSWFSTLRVRVLAAMGALACVAGLASPAGAVTERRVALVVGNGAYASVPALANPRRDAQAMSASLKRLGFEVVEGYDLGMDDMRSIVRDFAQKLDGAKAGVVYYAGHGIAVGDENYLIPVDASLKSEADLDFRALNVQLVLRQMQRDERVNILILDACRDNPFASQLAAKSRSVARGLTPIETQSASGILIAFATDPRATALDGEKDGNSPFTSALLKHIETPEVSITTVMDRVRADVWDATGKKQKPWTNSSIIGEFKMNPSLKLAAADPTASVKMSDATAPAAVAPVAGLDRSQMDVKTWEIAERGNSRADYDAYLQAFPTGQFAIFARNRLAKLEDAPQSGSGASRMAASVDDALKTDIGTAETENALKLAARDRRELQTRLRASGIKLAAVSGSFGPDQRKAFRDWQEKRGIKPTGFLSALQVKALREQSEVAYQAILSAEKPAPVAERKTRRIVAEPREPRTRGYAYERDPVIRRDLARERAGQGDHAGNAAGAAIFGNIVGGAIGGVIGGRFRR